MSALDLKQKTQNGEQIRAGNCPCQAFFSLLYFFIVAGSVIISRLGAAMAFMSLLHFIVIIFTCRICCVYSECTLPPTSMGFSHIFRTDGGWGSGCDGNLLDLAMRVPCTETFDYVSYINTLYD